MRRSQQKQQQRFLRVNERIRARQVRLIDSDGTQLGIVPIREAQRAAREKNLDLIEVAPDASPPVCKIMDYGKYRYEQGKREKSSQRRQKSAEIKIVRLRPGTDDHDLKTKQRQAERFLRQGHKVQFNVFFRGREVSHPGIAREQLERIFQGLKPLATVERRPVLQGRQMIMLIAPRPDMPPLPQEEGGDEAGRREGSGSAPEDPPDGTAKKAGEAGEVVEQEPEEAV